MDAFDEWVAQTTRQYRRVRKEPDDERLIDEARSGGQAATSELQSRYGAQTEQRLVRADNLSAEHATVVVNDVFMRLPKLLEKYHHTDRFEQFLFVCAYNRWRTVRRGLKRDPSVAVDPATLNLPVDLSAPTRIDIDLIVARAEALLPAADREAWRLSLEGYSPAQIGEMLDITPGAASARLNRAWKRLRELMAEYLERRQGPSI